uniref:Oligopeptide transporter 7-like n=1 Tax=Rhizophora mucronata TaxID=61149 RepID=A0A2P2PUC8_RHIMU
MRWPSGTTAI